jgi:hypothetical protein
MTYRSLLKCYRAILSTESLCHPDLLLTLTYIREYFYWGRLRVDAITPGFIYIYIYIHRLLPRNNIVRLACRRFHLKKNSLTNGCSYYLRRGKKIIYFLIRVRSATFVYLKVIFDNFHKALTAGHGLTTATRNRK